MKEDSKQRMLSLVEGTTNQYQAGGPSACGFIAVGLTQDILCGCHRTFTSATLDAAVRRGAALHSGGDHAETFDLVYGCDGLQVVAHQQFEDIADLVDYLCSGVVPDGSFQAVIITKPPETVAMIFSEGCWWYCDSHPRPSEGHQQAFAEPHETLEACVLSRVGCEPLIAVEGIPELNICEAFLVAARKYTPEK